MSRFCFNVFDLRRSSTEKGLNFKEISYSIAYIMIIFVPHSCNTRLHKISNYKIGSDDWIDLYDRYAGIERRPLVALVKPRDLGAFSRYVGDLRDDR